MFDYLLTDEQRNLKQEVRQFVKSIPTGKLVPDIDQVKKALKDS